MKQSDLEKSLDPTVYCIIAVADTIKYRFGSRPQGADPLPSKRRGAKAGRNHLNEFF
jgi:hypothetical protein